MDAWTTRYMSVCLSVCSKHGVSYYNPQMDAWTTSYMSLEAAVKQSAKLLLFVILADTRAITSMLEVGSISYLSICEVSFFIVGMLGVSYFYVKHAGG